LLLQKEINTGSLGRKNREERNTGRKKEKQKGGKKHWSREKGEINKKQARPDGPSQIAVFPPIPPTASTPGKTRARSAGRVCSNRLAPQTI
jgi:hypothetical protein